MPLDDCLYSLQNSIPNLTRSNLYRLFKRNGIEKLPDIEGNKSSKKKKFKIYPIGYFHIDIAEVRTEEGKLYMFVAIDRTSKFAYVELHEKYGKLEAADSLRNLIKAVPYHIHIILYFLIRYLYFIYRRSFLHFAPEFQSVLEMTYPLPKSKNLFMIFL